MTQIVDPPCAQTDPDSWFADGTGEDQRTPHIKQAMKICGGCPFKAQCARAALDAVVDDVWVQGVWAGVYVPRGRTRSRVDAVFRLETLSGVTVRKLKEAKRLRELVRLERLESQGLVSWGDVYAAKAAA